MRLNYRPDIDGLRALAVLSVLLFHANVPGFSGGFVGVDVFFVISGYLITSIILRELETGRFSMVRFYERRMRRILPALFPVVLVTALVGGCLFDAVAYKNLGKSVCAAVFSYSNFFFLGESGYFDAPSLQKPLLHTWSLAVEEQFYLLFPLVLSWVYRFCPRAFLSWLGFAMALSFGISVAGVNSFPAATFYLVPTRAWEFLIGSLIAFPGTKAPSMFWVRNCCSMIGLGLIACSVVFYTDAMPFPGFNALAPSVGAGLVIYANSETKCTWVQSILKWRPLVFVGLISYSLYLWHWPLVAFWRYLLFRPFQAWECVVMIGLSFVFGVLSWRFIEQPFRNETVVSRRSLLTAVAVLTVGTGLLGQVIRFQRGMPWRHPQANLAMRECTEDVWWQTSGTFSDNPEAIRDFLDGKRDPTEIGALGGEPSFILWGDSHARALIPAISGQAKEFGLRGFAATKGGGCPPILGIENNNTSFSEVVFNDAVIRFIEGRSHLKTVILAGRWPLYLKEVSLRDVWGDSKRLESAELMVAGLRRTVEKLRALGRRVVVLSDVPELPESALRWFWLRQTIYSGLPLDFPKQREADYRERNRGLYECLEKGFSSEGVSVLFPDKWLFDEEGLSIIERAGKLFYRDRDHLSAHGAEYLAPMFEGMFRDMMLRD